MKEKTHQPTPKKLQDARKKGQIAKSKEIATCITIVILFAYLLFLSKHYISHISQIMLIPSAYYESDFLWAVIDCAKKLTKEFIILSVPIALCAMVVTVLSYMLQFGVIFASEPIQPDFNRINPIEGFKRIFSWKNLFELIKSVLKIALLGVIVYLIIKSNFKLLFGIPVLGVKAIIPLLLNIIGKLMLYVSCIFIVFAIIDYFFEKKLYLHNMKMSIDDIKQEHKDREGDPQVKGYRRQLQREIAMAENMLSRIEKSIVLITASNKIAIAIYYEHGKTKLPIITVKSQEFLAKKATKMAMKCDTTIIEDAYLAKKLFETGSENSYIPVDLIEPMAKLLFPLISAKKKST